MISVKCNSDAAALYHKASSGVFRIVMPEYSLIGRLIKKITYGA